LWYKSKFCSNIQNLSSKSKFWSKIKNFCKSQISPFFSRNLKFTFFQKNFSKCKYVKTSEVSANQILDRNPFTRCLKSRDFGQKSIFENPFWSNFGEKLNPVFLTLCQEMRSIFVRYLSVIWTRTIYIVQIHILVEIFKIFVAKNQFVQTSVLVIQPPAELTKTFLSLSTAEIGDFHRYFIFLISKK